MADICVLITSEYPYKTQETFIEDEIRFLSESFDRILIFSLDILSDEKRRPVPDNAVLFPIGRIARNSKRRLPSYVLGGLLHRPFFKEKTGNPKKYLMKTYISGKSRSEAAIILQHLRTELKKKDRVCIYSYWFMNHAMVACRLKQALRNDGFYVKAFSRGHGYDIYSERSPMNYNPYQKPMIRALDGVFTCSLNGQRYLYKKYGKQVCSGKVHVSRLGTLDHGVSMQKDFSEIHFVTCSHLSELKRVSLFARSFVLFVDMVKEMQASSPDNNGILSEADTAGLSPLLKHIDPAGIRWTCMGSGVEEEQIRKIIDESGLQEQVTFTGRIAHDDVMRFYGEHEITFFVNVSTTEGVPVSIMEAQSFGIPVIATDVGGTSEIVNTTNGRLLDAALTPEQLCAAMLQECDPDNIRKKQTASRADWEEQSFADRLYREWCGILTGSLH